MTEKRSTVPRIEDPKGHLEQAFIDEYLHLRGHDPAAVRRLPSDQTKGLLEAASTYAAGKLAEFEARAQYVHDIHSKD